MVTVPPQAEEKIAGFRIYVLYAGQLSLMEGEILPVSDILGRAPPIADQKRYASIGAASSADIVRSDIVAAFRRSRLGNERRFLELSYCPEHLPNKHRSRVYSVKKSGAVAGSPSFLAGS